MDLEQLKKDRDVLFAVLNKAVEKGGFGIVEATAAGGAMQRIGALIDGLRMQPKEEVPDGNGERESSGSNTPLLGDTGSDSDNGEANEAGSKASTDND